MANAPGSLLDSEDDFINPFFYKGVDFSKVAEIQFSEKIAMPLGERWRIDRHNPGESIKNVVFLPLDFGLEISCDWPGRKDPETDEPIRWVVTYPWAWGMAVYMQRTGNA